MSKTRLKHPIGYRYYDYEVIGTVQHKYGEKNRTYTKYVIKCLKCGEEIERNISDVGKDLKCPGCERNMEYYRFNVGQIVNGLEIIEKQRQIRGNGKTQRGYLCKCIVDGYTSVHSEDNLLKGKGCPVCGQIIIVRGINDINTVAPWLGDLLENKDDSYVLGVGSHAKRRFRCPHCGTLTKPIAIYNVFYNKHISCRKCGDGISMPEKIMYNLLEQLGVDFEFQKTFDWSDRKIYDFYLKGFDMIIETHGLQHYRQDSSGSWIDPEEVKKNDLFKKNNAMQNGISLYIEVDCSKSDPLSLIQACKDSLSMYFNFDNIDFNDVIFNSATSFCIRTGNLWNAGVHDISLISDLLHIKKPTIKKYLKTLTHIGYINV